ncbi:MAG: diguanylate cyclase [Desulfobacterales bacterium]|nr:diguanylate cyclase [Desulfobacterales bacterium]
METPKPKILIIDDSVENIRILMETLKSDYNIVPARNGETAIAKALSARPDLILLDIIMPEMDGYEVCQRLKADEQTQNIPVIFITAKTDVMDETKAFSIGAVDYITKPFIPIVVKARVKSQIDLKQKNDLLEHLVAVDGLTGLNNRRKFDEVYPLEWFRAKRNHSSLSLIMIDIDQFKEFNDCYGHAGGDDCLRLVAAELQHNVARAGDFLARYGGEEFVVLLSDTDHQGVKSVAANLKEKIKALKIPHCRSTVSDYVTISLGVATTKPSARTHTALSFLKAADKRLYKAKSGGRNQLCAD